MWYQARHYMNTMQGTTMKKASAPLAIALASVAAMAGLARAESPPVMVEPQVRLSEHSAVYDLELTSASQRSGIVSASGRIAVEISGGGCSGWANETRMVISYMLRKRGEQLVDSRNTSHEAHDGSSYRFIGSDYLNGARTSHEELKGERKGAGGSIIITFTKPRKMTRELPAETLFPAQATKKVIAAAIRGEKSLSMLVYEGFKDGRPRRVSVIIGQRLGEGHGAPAELKGLRAWPLSMAYYKVSEISRRGFGLPEYEISMRMYENGVITAPVLTYDDHTLRGRLSKLRMGRREETCK